MVWLVVVEWLARLILILLLGLSVWSFAIIIDRRRFFKSLSLPGPATKDALRQGTTALESHMFTDLTAELARLASSEKKEKFFDAYLAQKRKSWEQGLAVLATLGSTAPFIGLLGTVLGIIVSFGQLSQGSGNTNTVMFALAEALVLTAVGLIVAIPAVVAFNYFNRQVKLLLSTAQELKDLFIAYRG